MRCLNSFQGLFSFFVNLSNLVHVTTDTVSDVCMKETIHQLSKVVYSMIIVVIPLIYQIIPGCFSCFLQSRELLNESWTEKQGANDLKPAL